jgi:hypothetical protein
MHATRSLPAPYEMFLGAFSWQEFFDNAIETFMDTCMPDDRSLDKFHAEADRLRAVAQCLDECATW